jgi:hypothetical protein
VFHRANVDMSSPGPLGRNVVHRRCGSIWIVSIGGSQLDVFDFLLFLDALFDEQHLADIGSFVDGLARLDDTGQVHQNGSVHVVADLEDGLALGLELQGHIGVGVELSVLDDLPKVVTILAREHAEYEGLIDGRIPLLIRVATIIMMFFMSNVLLTSMIQGKSNSLHRLREEETGFAELHSIVRGGHQRRKRLLRKAPPLLSPRAAKHGPVVALLGHECLITMTITSVRTAWRHTSAICRYRGCTIVSSRTGPQTGRLSGNSYR